VRVPFGVDVPIPTLPVVCCTTKLFGPVIPPAKDDVAVAVKVPTTVELACDTKPFVNVPRPVCVSAPSTESEPNCAAEAKRFVLDAVVEKKLVEVAFASVVLPEKVLAPENVLLLASSVDDAAVMVMSLVPSNAVPLMLRGVWRAVAVDALPVSAPMKLVNHEVVPERSVVVALVKVLRPVQLFLSERIVDDAAVMVMLAVPSNVVPLMVRPVWSAEAVPALPPIESDAAVPVRPVPAPANDEPVTAPVAVKLPTTVEDACDTKPFANVERPDTLSVVKLMRLAASVPNDAVVAKRFVLEAVVEKKFVDVALASVVFPEKVVAPENVLLLARSVEDAAVMVISLVPSNTVPLMFRAV
jgi:hypothetical protein